MTDYGGLIRTIQLYFSTKTSFSDIKFVTEFPKMKKSQPLARPTVSVGIESITDKKVDGVYDKSNPPVLLYNRIAVMKIQFFIHVPQSHAGVECYDIATRIAAALLESNFNYNFDQLDCDSIKYDRDIGTFVQKAVIGITDKTIDS